MTQLLRPDPTAAGRRSGPVRHLEHLQHLLEHTLVGPAAVAAAAVGVMATLQAADPNEPGHYPSCPLLSLTGLWCPGCGSMRMLHHLGDGDLVAAAAMNPLALALLPVLLGYWVQWVRRAATGRSRGAPAPAWLVWGFLVVSVGYAVLRNLPGMGVLAPG